MESIRLAYLINKKGVLLFKLILLLLNPSVAQKLPKGFPDTERTKLNINQGWKFHLGDADKEYFKSEYDDSQWESVNVPHTLELASLTLNDVKDDKTQLVFQRKVGWYRKDINVSDSKKKVFLEFEGAHQITNLWVNGRHVGEHAVGGYTPFHFDITNYVKRGAANQVTLLVDNRRNETIPPDPGPFDYIKFSGLYRDLYLVETDPLRVTFNWESLNSGVIITTPTIDVVNKNATVNIKTSVKNEHTSEVDCQLLTRVLNRKGETVLRLIQSQKILPNQEFQFNQIGSLEDDVHFWGIDNPYLYRVNSVVMVNGKEVDFVENKLGLRKFEQDPVRGFLLNNKPIELIGFNRHQHYAYIGDALPNSLHYKDMLQFKEYGYNVMRTAHYPQDDALIEACDELGILVYEEAPTWISVSQNDLWWDNLEKSARTMVRNHRNHPSIVMWGAGVNHRGYVPRVHNAIKQEDPTRLTASQGSRWTGWQASGLTDINANMLYGSFIWDRSEPIFAMEGRTGPVAVAPYKRDPLMTGLISWTAHAYHTFHPTHSKHDNPRDRTRSGAMTIFRYSRPKYEWYKAELLEEHMVFIQQDWTESTKEVTVFSNADEVELFLNGKSLARNKPSMDTVYQGLDHPPFHFKDIIYEPGELLAKAYFKNNKTLQFKRTTPQKPYAIKLRIDTVGRSFVADGSDILVVYARVVDKNGETLRDFDGMISFSVKGDASIIGDGTNIKSNPMFTEYGVAPALIKAGTNPGEITIYAKSKGLKTGIANTYLLENDSNEIRKNASPIIDVIKERVDIGGPGQLLQFGWNPWNGSEKELKPYQFTTFKGATASLRPNSDEGITRWLGEMNVIGKYGFAYGDGVLAIDDQGVNLILEGLPKGDYSLTTWHHAPKSNSDHMDPNREKLKKMTVFKLPYEKRLEVYAKSANDKKTQVTVTDGKQMQWKEPGKSTIWFTSDGESPVSIHYDGSEGKGIWINAFELKGIRN